MIGAAVHGDVLAVKRFFLKILENCANMIPNGGALFDGNGE